jgi:hypothetical protein
MKPSECADYEGSRITNATEIVDGNTYTRCQFHGCRLEYHGGKPPVFRNCVFNDCTWGFRGGAARMLKFLKTQWDLGPEHGHEVVLSAFQFVTGERVG